MISAGYGLNSALKADGTVVAAGENGESQVTTATGWTGVKAVEQHGYGENLYAILDDGTAVGAGDDGNSQISGISTWTDLTQIAGGANWMEGFVCALKSDGTVEHAGFDYGQSDAEAWTDVVQIACGVGHVVGLKSDGTVVAAGLNNYSQVSGVSSWADVVQVSAGHYHTVGVKSDGTVVGCGWDSQSQATGMSAWTGIDAVAAGYQHTLGLKSDGTVVVAGSNSSGESNVTGWTDIIQLAAGYQTSVGLKSDGSVVATGSNSSSQSSTAVTWTGINTDLGGAEVEIEVVIDMVPSVGVKIFMTLTGAADSTTDVQLPMTNVNARIRSGRDSYLSVTIPYRSDLAAAVAARPNGDLYLTYVDAADTYAVVNVALETVQPSRAVGGGSIVLTGHRQSTNSSPTSHTDNPAKSLQTGTSASTAIMPGYDPAIKPADTITVAGETYVVDVVSLQAAVGSIQTQLIGA